MPNPPLFFVISTYRLRNACALLFPIDWPEPFGLVMIEAMACGTPVIGWRCGSVPEVVTDGVSGFVVDSIEQAVDTVGRVQWLSRRDCRRVFEERFDPARMARDYLHVYRRLARGGPVLETFLPAAQQAPFGRRPSRPQAPLLGILPSVK